MILVGTTGHGDRIDLSEYYTLEEAVVGDHVWYDREDYKITKRTHVIGGAILFSLELQK